MDNRIALWRDAPDCDAAAELASLLGWASVIIEAAEDGGRRAFFDACSAGFGFPDYFRHTWDAFEECLESQEFDEIEDLDDADGILILWSGWGDLAESEPEQFAIAIDVLRDVLRVWEAADLSARVVLIGDGPQVSLGQHRTAREVFNEDDYELVEPAG